MTETKTEITPVGAGRDLEHYDPERGLKTIYAAEAVKKALVQQLRNNPNDPFARQKLREVIEAKITEQAEYVVWRGGVVVPSRKAGIAGPVAASVASKKTGLLVRNPLCPITILAGLSFIVGVKRFAGKSPRALRGSLMKLKDYSPLTIPGNGH